MEGFYNSKELGEGTMPEEKGGGPSMFETVKNHEERIINLEEADKKHEERLQELEKNSIKLENTIMQENRDTRTTMKEQTEKLFLLVENAMGYQSSKTAQDHELKVLKLKTYTDVFLKFTAAGGLLYVVITEFIMK